MKRYLDALADELKVREAAKTATTVLTTDLDAGGALTEEEADQFITEVVNESMFLQMARLHRTNKPSGKINFMNITSHVTEAADEDTDSGNVVKPSFRKLTYATKKTRTAVDISGESLEDSIEGAGAQQTIMNGILAKMGSDMETLAWEGDESVAGSDAYSRLVQTNDGWLTQLTQAAGVHHVDAGNKKLSFDLMSEMFRNLPSKWKRRIGEFKWIMSWSAAQALVEAEAARLTDLGDNFRVTGALPNILGIPVVIVPLFPEDLTLTGTASQGTECLLAQPQNFIYVVQRDVSIEWERVPRKDRWEATVYMRTDFIVEQPDAIVRAVNVNIDPTAASYS